MYLPTVLHNTEITEFSHSTSPVTVSQLLWMRLFLISVGLTFLTFG